MSPATPLVSFAPNHEDVVLWRALGDVPSGRYVEICTGLPSGRTVTRALYERGWTGIVVEADDERAESHRADRSRDVVVATGSAAVAAAATAPGDPANVHVMVVDTAGTEHEVLSLFDLRSFRPWVLVIRATAPGSAVPTRAAWEDGVVTAGYRPCLFDGVSQFYVAEEHADRYGDVLAYPACSLDGATDATTLEALRDREVVLDELRRWRSEALSSWSGASAPAGELARARAELAAVAEDLHQVRNTLSWRITRPLRAARRRADHA